MPIQGLKRIINWENILDIAVDGSPVDFEILYIQNYYNLIYLLIDLTITIIILIIAIMIKI